jgi:uncharacterized protein (DUF488 family)
LSSIYAIGHSTHPIEEFISLLKSHGILIVADVRTVPRSRHVPQFNQESLKAALKAEGLNYRHFKQLGGLRKPRRDSTNLGWKNSSFRGFADYMETDEFESGIAEMIKLAESDGPVAIMCAEALPWRCHRRILADAFVALGWTVLDIMPAGKTRPHELPPFAHVRTGQVTYPGETLF